MTLPTVYHPLRWFLAVSGVLSLACVPGVPTEDEKSSRGSSRNDDDTALDSGSNDTGGATDTGGGTDTDAPDTTGPVITHTPVANAVLFGEDVNIEASITDDESWILLATLWYKQETQGSSDYSQRAMVEDADGVYRAVIPASAQGSSGMDYAIEAVNASNLRTFAPSEGRSYPYNFRLTQ